MGVTRKISSLQQLAALAIMGALRTMATDILDLHAGILLVNLFLRKICHQVATRLASLPPAHLLHVIYWLRVVLPQLD